MEIVYLKKENIYIPLNWNNEIKNNVLSYFIYGEGYKKTKSFKILDEKLPEKYENNLSWFDIILIHDKFGIEISNEYAETKTAGIVSRQTIYGYHFTYKIIKDIIPNNFNHDFFKCLAYDYHLACIGIYLFDIVATDKCFSRIDSEYNPTECTYKNLSCNMNEYVLQKYGESYVNIINKLMESN